MATRAARKTATAATPAKPGVRALAAQATRDSILRAATKVFAKHGFAGGRVEQISQAARSYDRMIYYYFGSKEGLFIAVIEDTYRRFNEAESALELDTADRVAALQAVIRFVWPTTRRTPSSSPCSTARTCCAASTSPRACAHASTRRRRWPSPTACCRPASRRACSAPTSPHATCT